MDSEGNDIVKNRELGLLLYRGGTVCNYGYYYQGHYNRLTVGIADAICRQMNFTRAERWTTEESFDIQSNYDIELWNVRCSSEDWGNCTYSGNSARTRSAIDRNCPHSKDVFLSCSGKELL